MSVRLVVTAGPHVGKEFAFDRHDTFLVGRHSDAHLQLSYDDPYFSRRHFLIEVNPPRVRVIDVNSRNGIFLNGQKVQTAELKDADELRAGHTIFRITIPKPHPNQQVTLDLPADLRPIPARTEPALQTQLEIPGYTLGDELGRGGMGVVYRATRQRDGLPVAIKMIIPMATVNERQLRRFVRETEVMASLAHPHVVAHLDSGTTGGLAYLAMELVEGLDAGKMIKEQGPLPIPMAVRMATQMLLGLAHAHQKGFVHRDLKPGNLLIGRDGKKRFVKVADFGLARAYDDCQLSGLTMQGEIGGSPAYMAPEQVTHFRDVKPSADQYSAAATLYALLTTLPPLDLPKDIAGQIAAVIDDDPVPIRSRRPEIPAGLAEVIHQALARDPAARFPTVQQFSLALRPYCD